MPFQTQFANSSSSLFALRCSSCFARSNSPWPSPCAPPLPRRRRRRRRRRSPRLAAPPHPAAAPSVSSPPRRPTPRQRRPPRALTTASRSDILIFLFCRMISHRVLKERCAVCAEKKEPAKTERWPQIEKEGDEMQTGGAVASFFLSSSSHAPLSLILSFPSFKHTGQRPGGHPRCRAAGENFLRKKRKQGGESRREQIKTAMR